MPSYKATTVKSADHLFCVYDEEKVARLVSDLLTSVSIKLENDVKCLSVRLSVSVPSLNLNDLCFSFSGQDFKQERASVKTCSRSFDYFYGNTTMWSSCCFSGHRVVFLAKTKTH